MRPSSSRHRRPVLPVAAHRRLRSCQSPIVEEMAADALHGGRFAGGPHPGAVGEVHVADARRRACRREARRTGGRTTRRSCRDAPLTRGGRQRARPRYAPAPASRRGSRRASCADGGDRRLVARERGTPARRSRRCNRGRDRRSPPAGRARPTPPSRTRHHRRGRRSRRRAPEPSGSTRQGVNVRIVGSSLRPAGGTRCRSSVGTTSSPRSGRREEHPDARRRLLDREPRELGAAQGDAHQARAQLLDAAHLDRAERRRFAAKAPRRGHRYSNAARVRGVHLGAEAVERPRPHGGDAAVVEVPALAARDPHRVLRGFDSRRPRAAPSRRAVALISRHSPDAQPLDELHDVAELQLGDLDQREVADRAVRAVEHEEVREVRDRDREVRARARGDHASSSVTPSRPVTAIGRMNASALKPVASTSTSSSCSTPSLGAHALRLDALDRFGRRARRSAAGSRRRSRAR